jgi:hypothetical protein
LSGTEGTNSRSEKAIVALRPALADATKKERKRNHKRSGKRSCKLRCKIGKSKTTRGQTELRVCAKAAIEADLCAPARNIEQKYKQIWRYKTDAETL